MAVSLLGLSPAATATEPASSFADVEASTPFAADITWLKTSGISRGYSGDAFHPTALLTRAALAAFLYRMAGSPAVSAREISAATARLTDITGKNRFKNAIAWLYSKRITTGYANGTFRPSGPVSRDAISAFLFRYGTSNTDAAASNYRPGTFTDVSRTTPFAGDIAWLAAAGSKQSAQVPISHGYPDKTYRPHVLVRRDMAAAFLHRTAEAAEVEHAAPQPPAPVALAITTTSLPAASIYNAYTATVSATDATSISLGPLPAGLTSSGGAIIGTPTSEGTTDVTVTATGPSGTVTKTLRLTVGAHVWTVSTLPVPPAGLNNLWGVAVDNDGNLYVADRKDGTVWKVTPQGYTKIATISGTPSLDGLALDKDGNIYVGTDFGNVWEIPLAGGDPAEYTTGLTNSRGVAIDKSNGNVWIADQETEQILEKSASGMTAFGSSTKGYHDGNATSAQFNLPLGVAVAPDGTVYVADTYNNVIRKISTSGEVTTLAGSLSGTAGHADGNGTAATFDLPVGIAVDSIGNIFVADTGSYTIREITPKGDVTTIAGQPGVQGGADGAGAQATFEGPTGLAVTGSGADEKIYVTYSGDSLIRELR